VQNEGADEVHGSLGSGETRGGGAPQAAREWRVDASREDARRRASDLAAGDIARARQTVSEGPRLGTTIAFSAPPTGRSTKFRERNFEPLAAAAALRLHFRSRGRSPCRTT
jgi:hypothetical protein